MISNAHAIHDFFPVSEGGMRIKWVDNTHALGVFSNESAGKGFDCAVYVVLGLSLQWLMLCHVAIHALSICHPLLKTRALAEGSKKAQGKAFRRAGRISTAASGNNMLFVVCIL